MTALETWNAATRWDGRQTIRRPVRIDDAELDATEEQDREQAEYEAEMERLEQRAWEYLGCEYEEWLDAQAADLPELVDEVGR